MNATTNSPTNRIVRSFRTSLRMVAYIAFLFIPLVTNAASGTPEDEVRATFERFVAAQNAHDVKAVESLLLKFPGFSLDHAGDAGVGTGPRLETLYRAL